MPIAKDVNKPVEGNQKMSLEGIPERGSARFSARAPWRSPLGTRIAEGKRARATRPEKDIFDCQTSLRGYSKISDACKAFNFDFRGKTVLDIGSSTGGFTEYALDHGAKKVIAVEKGTNQMKSPLRHDPRIDLHEKTDFFDFKTNEKIDVILADISFLSLTNILQHAKKISLPSTEFLVMLKPQFEARSDQLNRGVVKNEKIRRDIIKHFEQWLKQNNFCVINKHDNSLKGKTGNRERFYYLKLAK